MAEKPFQRFRQFFAELKRRNVYKVAVAYLAVAFVGIQAAQLLVPPTTLPGWADDFLIYVAVFGFPIALVIAWAFEMTPDGMRRTPETASEKEMPEAQEDQRGTRRAVQILAALGLIAVAGAGIWQFTPLGDEDEPTNASTPRIAVLPFEDIAGDTANLSFARGIHSEVWNQLSKVSGLDVISRTSVMQYRQTNKTVREISNELGGIDALLEGTVDRAAGRVRIRTQLIAAPKDEDLWSKTYEREVSPEAIFDIQADIAEQIAGALETRLTGDERRRIRGAPTADLAAYESFLRGREQVWQFWGRWTPELLNRAGRNLGEAVRRDSSFAEAHALLAHVHLGRIWNRPASEAPRWIDSATAAVERARRIDPDLAAVHFAQARVYDFQDSLEAEAEALRRVLEQQPSHALAKSELAGNLGRRGQYAPAVRLTREAVRLDPRRPTVLVGTGDRLGDVRMYDAAEAWYRHALEVEPEYTAAYAGLSFNELEQGRAERALAIWENYFEQVDDPPGVSFFFATLAAMTADRPEQAHSYLRKDPNYPTAGSELSVGWSESTETRTVDPSQAIQVGFIELHRGNEEWGRRLLREGVEGLQGETHRGERLSRPFGVWLAGGLAMLGRTEEALQEVQWVAEEGPGRDWLTWYPLLDPLRSNPQFQDILHRLEKRREEAREEVRRMDLDLYPPGAEPDSAVGLSPSDD